MTAIAYSAGVMAADSASFVGSLKIGTRPKIVRRDDGALAGASGDVTFCQQFRRLFLGSKELVEFRPNVGKHDGGFQCIVVLPGGGVWLGDQNGLEEAPAAGFYTLGAAWDFLAGALAAGADAEEAVRLAIAHRGDCGPPVVTLRLPGMKGSAPPPLDPLEELLARDEPGRKPR